MSGIELPVLKLRDREDNSTAGSMGDKARADSPDDSDVSNEKLIVEMFSKRKTKDALSSKPKRIEVSSAPLDHTTNYHHRHHNGTSLDNSGKTTPGNLEVIYENVSGGGGSEADETSPTYEKTPPSSQRKSNNNNNKSDKSPIISSSKKKVSPQIDRNEGFVNAGYSSSSPVTSKTSSPKDSRAIDDPKRLHPVNSNMSSNSSSSANSQASSATPSQISNSETNVSQQSISSSSSKHSLSSDEAWLKTMESRLATATKGNDILTLAQFKQALKVKESFFVDRFFDLIDKEKNGFIPRKTMMEELRAITLGTQTEKIKFLFNIYNIKGTGKILKSEVQEVLKNCIQESRIHVSAENLQALTNAIIMAADKDRDGKISFDELRDLVERYPSIAENMAISTLLTPVEPNDSLYADIPAGDAGERTDLFCCRHFTWRYIANNLKKVSFFIFFLVVNLALMAVAIWQYWDSNHWIKVARANGMALNFNSSFIVVLVLRVTTTWLRNTPLVRVFPFDQYIMFHKLCGYMILLQSLLHTGAHIGNAFAVAEGGTLEVWEILLTTKVGLGWVGHSAYITGYILIFVLLVMIVLSLPMVRKSGYFEVFYWSHKLYLVFWIVLIIHAGNFWKWFVVPGFIFLVELVTRLKWVRSAYMGKTYIERVCLLPSEVTQLIITRQPGFNYKPGDYVFIQIPDIAKYEWHPFTISSAPEDKDKFWLHIRSAGYWTKTLHEYFSSYTPGDEEQGMSKIEEEQMTQQIKLRRRASSIAWLKSKSVKARKIKANIMSRVVTRDVRVQVHIDGPYGTASRHIFEAEHAVLIGSGIGITPFASILQSIVHQYKAKQVKCPRCSYNWCHETPSMVMNLRKVDFVWINRDQRHFEWFASLLSRLEREQEVEGGIGHILDMHMFMTSALPKTDMKGLGLQLALDLVHQIEKTDLITGLQTRTQAGRPNFDELFTKIRKGSNVKIKVFFCGSPVLGKVVKEYSHKHGFAFAHEYF